MANLLVRLGDFGQNYKSYLKVTEYLVVEQGCSAADNVDIQQYATTLLLSRVEDIDTTGNVS